MHLHSKRKQTIDYFFSEVSRPSSDRTWDAFHGITFASSHGNTPSQTVPHVAHSRPAQVTSAQIDPSLWTEPQTRHLTGSRGENPEGSGNVIPSNKPVHMLEGQCRNATMTPNSNDDAPSSGIGHPENCLASDINAFRTPLGFHIPESKLREAMLAKPTSTASYWHFTLYQGPGGDTDKVKVHYCKNKETTERIAQLFLDKEVIGFDIEWHPSASASDGITKNVSLIQIASEERVLLAHIARYPDAAISEQEQRVEDFVAPSLKKIMYGIFRCCLIKGVSLPSHKIRSRIPLPKPILKSIWRSRLHSDVEMLTLKCSLGSLLR